MKQLTDNQFKKLEEQLKDEIDDLELRKRVLGIITNAIDNSKPDYYLSSMVNSKIKEFILDLAEEHEIDKSTIRLDIDDIDENTTMLEVLEGIQIKKGVGYSNKLDSKLQEFRTAILRESLSMVDDELLVEFKDRQEDINNRQKIHNEKHKKLQADFEVKLEAEKEKFRKDNADSASLDDDEFNFELELRKEFQESDEIQESITEHKELRNERFELLTAMLEKANLNNVAFGFDVDECDGTTLFSMPVTINVVYDIALVGIHIAVIKKDRFGNIFKTCVDEEMHPLGCLVIDYDDLSTVVNKIRAYFRPMSISEAAEMLDTGITNIAKCLKEDY